MSFDYFREEHISTLFSWETLISLPIGSPTSWCIFISPCGCQCSMDIYCYVPCNPLPCVHSDCGPARLSGAGALSGPSPWWASCKDILWSPEASQVHHLLRELTCFYSHNRGGWETGLLVLTSVPSSSQMPAVELSRQDHYCLIA